MTGELTTSAYCKCRPPRRRADVVASTASDEGAIDAGARFFFFFFSDDASALFRFFVGAEVTTPGGAEPSRGSRVAFGKKRARMSRGWSLPL